MRGFLFVLVLLVAGVVALGFYRGWFSAEKTNDPESGRQGVKIEVNPNKINPDIDKVKEKVGAGTGANEKSGGQ